MSDPKLHGVRSLLDKLGKIDKKGDIRPIK